LQKSGPDRFRDEAGTLAALRERRKGVLTPLVGEYHGRIVKVMGDGVFAVGATFLILARRSLTRVETQ
jgi:class 3 adenylate cyclase